MHEDMMMHFVGTLTRLGAQLMRTQATRWMAFAHRASGENLLNFLRRSNTNA